MGGDSNIVIVNNTTYHGNSGEVLLQYKNSGITVENNILVAKSGVAYVATNGAGNTNVTVDKNLYYGASATSPEAGSMRMRNSRTPCS